MFSHLQFLISLLGGAARFILAPKVHNFHRYMAEVFGSLKSPKIVINSPCIKRSTVHLTVSVFNKLKVLNISTSF